MEHARTSIAKGSKSFALASRLFDRTTREWAWLLYGWCRVCDDIADGQDHGGAMVPVGAGVVRLAEMRAKTDAALCGETIGDTAFDGLGVVARECGLPARFAHDVIDGFALDAVKWRPQSTDDLLRYCYHVAGAVGLMMAVVMGVSPDDETTLDRACDLGLAFQLANIARDVGEDAAAGRCYIPRDWLDEFGIVPDTLMNRENRPKLAHVGARLAAMAALYEGSARHGTPALSFRSSWAVLAAAGIYGDIAREVARRGEGAWDARVITSKRAKLCWVMQALGQAMVRRGRWPARDIRNPALWCRPMQENPDGRER
ncbi:MAG: phytoene/squalene synthase family protein [Sphingobium sp.]